jgi:ketosteroid isomerase-like protein
MTKIWPSLIAAVPMSCNAAAAGNTSTPHEGIEAFNHALIEATTHMDNAATLALWEEDGITLLPQTKPAIGRKAISAFLDEAMKQLPNARMEKFEMKCHDIAASGDWASEWCEEHQRVQLGDGKPPFDGSGVLLLVLHRGVDGKWRMKREMWNQAPAVESVQPAQ